MGQPVLAAPCCLTPSDSRADVLGVFGRKTELGAKRFNFVGQFWFLFRSKHAQPLFTIGKLHQHSRACRLPRVGWPSPSSR